jgi:hypothetical protein
MRRPKTAVTAEIVPRDRAQQADDFTRMVEQLVQQKVAEATEGRDALLQPWFQNREVTNAIKRHQTVTEQTKWSYYFEDWGCIVCAARRTVAHCALGMCGACYARTAQRLRATLRNHAPAPDQPQPTFMDTVKMAREALGPSITKLAAASKKRNRKITENLRSHERISTAKGGGSGDTTMQAEEKRLDYIFTYTTPRKFVRAADEHLNGQLMFETWTDRETLEAAFGPSQSLQWHFVREDGIPGFSLAAEHGASKEELSVKGHFVSEDSNYEFYLWTLDRLGAIESGEEASA